MQIKKSKNEKEKVEERKPIDIEQEFKPMSDDLKKISEWEWGKIEKILEDWLNNRDILKADLEEFYPVLKETATYKSLRSSSSNKYSRLLNTMVALFMIRAIQKEFLRVQMRGGENHA